MGSRWAEASADGAMSTVRAMVHAGSLLCHVTVGLWATRMHCLIAGHDDRFMREPGRLSLRCDECGRNTAGWLIGSAGRRAVSRLPGSSGSSVATEPEASGMLRPPLRLITPTRGT
jgi:hypothetical protein